MIDYACNVCGFLWAAIGEVLRCPDCESQDIERDEELDDEPISKS